MTPEPGNPESRPDLEPGEPDPAAIGLIVSRWLLPPVIRVSLPEFPGDWDLDDAVPLAAQRRWNLWAAGITWEARLVRDQWRARAVLSEAGAVPPSLPFTGPVVLVMRFFLPRDPVKGPAGTPARERRLAELAALTLGALKGPLVISDRQVVMSIATRECFPLSGGLILLAGADAGAGEFRLDGEAAWRGDIYGG